MPHGFDPNCTKCLGSGSEVGKPPGQEFPCSCRQPQPQADVRPLDARMLGALFLGLPAIERAFMLPVLARSVLPEHVNALEDHLRARLDGRPLEPRSAETLLKLRQTVKLWASPPEILKLVKEELPGVPPTT